MLFHTWTFFVFMLVVLPVYLLLRKTGGWRIWLLIVSYVFYGWWNPYYLFLVLYSTALDYAVVMFMERCPQSTHGLAGLSDRVLRAGFCVAGTLAALSAGGAIFGPPSLHATLWAATLILGLMAYGAARGSRRAWLGVSLVNNLFLLFFFKYARFFLENANTLFQKFGWNWTLPDPASLMPMGWEYLLPVGISFYTFQSLSYTIDFYRGEVQREKNFIRFATFVCFFPQLVAGPIERAGHMLPQFRTPGAITRERVTSGLSLFLVGLFKKLALANYISHYVERIYENPASWGAPALLLATVGFAWQIYFDFSGYSDMARGLGRLMGFELMENFRRPYLATGLGDFWGRWHISLSTWFRDYVYIPLGGNRAGKFGTYRNLFVTLLVSAVWHGAAWTFVIWGLLHAIGLVITRELERSNWYSTRVPRIFKQLGTFAFVCVTWIFFRADSLADAWLVLHRMVVGLWIDPQMPPLMLGLIGSVWCYEYLSESRWRPVLQHGWVRVGLATAMIVFMCLFSSKSGAFIYFQF
jgi:D-alanyl-lipoteichoic acid acyltransferase DltB (MBOAT superfamily)